MKTCTRCGETKNLSEFGVRRDRPCGTTSQCRKCACAYAKRRYHDKGLGAIRVAQRLANPEKYKDVTRKDRYGLEPGEFGVMFGKQEGLCAICCRVLDRGKHTHVDHNHTTDRVRGLLCRKCNHGVGNFLDNPLFLRTAASYLDLYA